MTGTAGCRCLTACSSSSPESPGMRISETRTSGAPPESASSASCAEENELKAMPSRLSAFSITQRMERSSSTIQRSEEHTSELQSLTNLVCRLLLEKKKIHTNISI